MVGKTITSNNFKNSGGAVIKSGTQYDYYYRVSESSQPVVSGRFDLDYAMTQWAFNDTLDNHNDYIFNASSFGTALFQATFYNDSGISQIVVNGHASGSIHMMFPGETLTVDGFITSIWANNHIPSGTSILRAVGIPVADITKLP